LILGMAGISMYIAKPISIGAPGPATGDGAEALAQTLATIASDKSKKCFVVAVDYGIRYSRAVERVISLLASAKVGHPGGPRISAIMARYNHAYTKPGTQAEGPLGPSVLQHSSDLLHVCRLLCGDAVLSTVQALTVQASKTHGNPGHLASLPKGAKSEGEVVLNAMWMFENGTMGSLMCGTLLHGRKSSAEIEIWADGIRIVMVDPLSENPVLSIRMPGSEADETEELSQQLLTAVDPRPPATPDGDPNLMAVHGFVHAVRTSRPEFIRTSYWDALRTHKLVFAIQEAAERAQARADWVAECSSPTLDKPDADLPGSPAQAAS